LAYTMPVGAGFDGGKGRWLARGKSLFGRRGLE